MTGNQNKSNEPSIVIISGPTATGKSDLACELASKFPAEIVNADMGQLYTPLSIGTAKPEWRSQVVPHHLFDVIDTARDCTVVEYKAMVMPVIKEIWARKATPIVVGGSGFYIQSLLFPPKGPIVTSDVDQVPDWNLLNAIDPDRAKKIHPHDFYRISRALNIWKATGTKPSTFSRQYNPLCKTCFLWVARDKQDLCERINKRVIDMIDQGWLDECSKLIGTPWEPFIHKKKLIGYPELCDYLRGAKNLKTLADVIEVIQLKARKYAKRQLTFWSMLKRQLIPLADDDTPVVTHEFNLTLDDPRLYINHLL